MYVKASDRLLCFQPKPNGIPIGGERPLLCSFGRKNKK